MTASPKHISAAFRAQACKTLKEKRKAEITIYLQTNPIHSITYLKLET